VGWLRAVLHFRWVSGQRDLPGRAFAPRQASHRAAAPRLIQPLHLASAQSQSRRL